MLTADELVDMRTALDESLPDEARVLNPVETDDGQGGTSSAMPLPADVEPVPCRLSPVAGMRSGETTSAGRLISETPWTITMPWGIAVSPKAVIQVTIVETGAVRSFEVVGPMDPRSYQIATRVLCTEVV